MGQEEACPAQEDDTCNIEISQELNDKINFAIKTAYAFD